jgi:hypothetical protein
MELCSIAAQGLGQAQNQFDRAAAQVATSSTAEAGTPPNAVDLDTVDLRQAAAGLLTAKGSFLTDIKLVQTADSMERQTLDLLA